jgi:hypothetical protein
MKVFRTETDASPFDMLGGKGAVVGAPENSWRKSCGEFATIGPSEFTSDT